MTYNIEDFNECLGITDTNDCGLATIDNDYSLRLKRAMCYSREWENARTGERNSLAYNHAAQLREMFNISENDILDIIGKWNYGNNPPLSQDELKRTIGNVQKYAKKTAGSGYTESHTSHRSLSDILEKKEVASPTDDWPEFIPIDSVKLPKFPLDNVPYCLGDFKQMVTHASKSIQVAEDMPAMIALSAISSSLNGNVKIQTNNSYCELANSFVSVFSRSGTRKSEVFNTMTRPVFDFENDLRSDLTTQIYQNRSEFKVLKSTVKELERRITKGEDEDGSLKDELARKSQEVAEYDKPITMPTLIMSDTTLERLSTMMKNNSGMMSIFDHEGSFFQTISGRYKGKGDMPSNDLLMKAYSGDRYTEHRITRDDVIIPKPVLTIGLCVQPTAIQNIRHKDFLNDTGLLPRFMFAMPADTIGRRTASTEEIPYYVLNNYNQRLGQLLTLTRKQGKAVTLTMSSDARKAYVEFFDYLEKRMPEGCELFPIRSWASKLCGNMTRIAAILHCFAYPELEKTEVSGEIMRYAIEIAMYLIEHAKAVYKIMRVDPTIGKAEKIARWIRRHEIDCFSKRDVFNALKNSENSIQKSKDMDEPLSLLQQHGYLRRVNMEKKVGRPTEKYQVNPQVFKY